MRLTAATVRTVQCAPGKSEQVFFDEALPGFGLRVRRTGAQTWLVQYAVAGRTKRVFLARRRWSTPAKRALWPRIYWLAFGWVAIQPARRWPRGPKWPTRSAPCCRGSWRVSVTG